MDLVKQHTFRENHVAEQGLCGSHVSFFRLLLEGLTHRRVVAPFELSKHHFHLLVYVHGEPQVVLLVGVPASVVRPRLVLTPVVSSLRLLLLGFVDHERYDDGSGLEQLVKLLI